jgi:hypothetical protein
VLASCADEIGEFSINEKTVCEVGGEEVTFDDYKYFFFRNYVSLYGTNFSKLDNERFNTVKALTEDALRRRAFIYQLCEEYDIELSDEDAEGVDTYVSAQIDEQGGFDKYKEWLVKNRLTGNVFRSQVELTFYYDPYLRELLQTGIDNRVDMTPKAIIDDVMDGNFYRYAQIYFEVPAGVSDRDAYAKITLAKQKLDSGMPFVDVANAIWIADKDERAKQKSEWTADAGEGVYVAKGQKEAILEDAVLKLDDGEYSEPVWSGNGWHIFIRLPLVREYVEQNIYTPVTDEYTIADQSFARRYLEYIANESKSIEIEYTRYFNNDVTFEMLLSQEEI